MIANDFNENRIFRWFGNTFCHIKFMETKEIKICVDVESAKIYESAIFADRQKLDALLSLRLKEFARKRRPLEVVMSDISRKAQARGLTPSKGELSYE